MNRAKALIEEALAGVEVVLCWRCDGWGVVGLRSMSATCPICNGAGRTTAHTTELEVVHEHHS